MNTNLLCNKKSLLIIAFTLISSALFAADSTKLIKTSSGNIWKSEFERFRKAVTTKDINSIKTFFKFPLENTGIWTTVNYSEPDYMDRPFTEKDFDLYAKKIFSKAFIRLLKGINIEENSEIIDKYNSITTWKYFKKTSHSLFVGCEDQILRITHLITRDGESSISYEFKFNSLGSIIITNIQLAG